MSDIEHNNFEYDFDDSYGEEEIKYDDLFKYKNEQDLKDNAISIKILIQDYCYNNGLNMCEKISLDNVLTLLNFN
jgi:hypothetical protein